MKNLEQSSTLEKIKAKREKDKVYLGIPSGSLNSQVVRLCQKAGFLKDDPGRVYEIPSFSNSDVIFRVLDRQEMVQEVEMGVVDAGITGKDYIEEFGNSSPVEVVSDFIFSKRSNKPSRLVLVSNPSDIETIEETRGKTIFTELPNLTRRRMQELFDFSTTELNSIFLSRGKTEQKLRTGRADVITDITETGTTIKANGFKELATIFESNPQLIARPESLKNTNIREIIEDFALSLNAILNAEKNPTYLVAMNVPVGILNDVLTFLPANKSPTITALRDPDWVSVQTVVPQNQFDTLAPKLLKLGVDGIIPTPAGVIYTQGLRESVKL